MLVLSIDADFFVEPVARDESVDSIERLPGDEYSVDSPEAIQAFFEQQCRLTSGSGVPGTFIRDHDQAFDILRELAERHGPVRLGHVDAHADLGMGDAGYTYLLSDWLPQEPRGEPQRDWEGLNLANWLAFAAAGGFLETVEFVPRHHPPKDLLGYYQDESDPSALIFRGLTDRDVDRLLTSADPRSVFCGKKVVQRTPFTTIHPREFNLPAPPDFVIGCQSPQFTPAAADIVLEVLRSYVEEFDLGLPLVRPAK